MKRKAMLKLGITLCLCIAIFLGFMFYNIISVTNVKMKIPVVKLQDGASEDLPAFKAGHLIEEDDIDYEEVTKGTINENIVTDGTMLVGCYALRNYYPNEHFYYNSLALDYPKKLKEKIRYNGIAVPVNLLKTVNGEIDEDDFIRISIVLSGDESATNVLNTSGMFGTKAKIVDTDYLAAVRVVGMYESDGSSSTDLRDSSGPNKRNTISPSFLVLDVDEIQRALLMNAKTTGSIEVTIIPESVQEYYRQAWGLSEENPSVDLDEEVLNEITTQHEEAVNMSEEESQKIANEEFAKAEDIEGSETQSQSGEEVVTPTEEVYGDLSQIEEVDLSDVETMQPTETPSADTSVDVAVNEPTTVPDQITSIDSETLQSTPTQSSIDNPELQTPMYQENRTVGNTVSDQAFTDYQTYMKQIALPEVAPDIVIAIPTEMYSMLQTLK